VCVCVCGLGKGGEGTQKGNDNKPLFSWLDGLELQSAGGKDFYGKVSEKINTL
jgi:hypothetical protein